MKCFAASARKLGYGLGISQEELAERADLHRTYIADLERASRNPTLLTIKKLAKGWGVSAADLFRKPNAIVDGKECSYEKTIFASAI